MNVCAAPRYIPFTGLRPIILTNRDLTRESCNFIISLYHNNDIGPVYFFCQSDSVLAHYRLGSNDTGKCRLVSFCLIKYRHVQVND